MPRLVVAAAMIAASGAGSVSAQEARWQIGFSSYVAEGRYGGDALTRFTYAPFTVRWMSRHGDLTATVPFLDVSSDSSVVIFRGQPQPLAPDRGTSPQRPGGRTTLDPRGAAPTPRPTLPLPQRTTTREKGLGDVALTGRLFVADAAGLRPAVDLVARLELPTGDPSRGLGLGAASTEVGLQLSKPLGRRFVWMADASYTFVGRPEDFEVRNTWEYAVGLGVYPFSSLLVGLSFEEWQPVSPSVASGRDLLATAMLKVSSALRLFASAQLPLSDSAPDFTAGAGLGVRF